MSYRVLARKYRPQNLEQLVDERSRELNLINEQLIREIECHKKARIKLKKSEQKYRELVENANSLIIKFDTLGYINFFFYLSTISLFIFPL